MNLKIALTTIIGLITLIIIAILLWWSHHHHPHVDPYSPPAQANRLSIYNHEVCRNACPAVQCTSDTCISLNNQFHEHEISDQSCLDWWAFFEQASSEDILPDSFYLCGHGKNNEWQKNAQQDQNYEDLWQCAWGPECSETQ